METISFAGGSLGHIPVLEQVLQQSVAAVDPKVLLEYSDPLGMPELRSRIAKLYGGITLDNVLITSSAQQALGIIAEYLAHCPDWYVQEPAYFGILRIARRQGIACTTFNTINALESKLRRSTASIVYLTSNFHNPTGETLPSETKKRLAERAETNGLVLIEDNPHDFLYFERQRPMNIFALAPHHTVYISGFSKILGPGLRVGYIIADRETIAGLKSVKISQDIFTSTLGQQVCAAALQHPEYLNELRQYCKSKRDLALCILEEQFGSNPLFTWNVPQGGIFIHGKFLGVEANAVLQAAKRHSLLLENDSYMYVDGQSRNTTRVNFVQNPDDVLREGIARLCKAFREVKNGS